MSVAEAEIYEPEASHSPAVVSGFGSSVPMVSDSGTTAIAVREDTEFKSAIVAARQFPRTEEVSYTKLMNACRRATFAEGALYAFPRGGTTVKGPSVDLAREAARVWGNMRYGLRVVSVDDDQVHIRGYALDLETNAYVEAEDRFEKRVQRKVKGGSGRTEWVKPDERDLRELVNRRGAILVRNCILQLIPPDVVDDATRQIESTMRKAANGDIEQSPEEARRRIIMSFANIGVTADMIERKLGHKLEQMNADELAELRQIGKSILDGNSKREDHFDFGNTSTVQSAAADDLNRKLSGVIPNAEGKPTPEVGALAALTPKQRKIYDAEYKRLMEDGADILDAQETAFNTATKAKG